MNKPIHPAVAEHVIEENERLRALLLGVLNTPRGTSGRIILEPDEEAAIRAALSKQVEPAPAQDERELPLPDITTKHGYPAYSVELVSRLLANRPEQTDQQPVAWVEVKDRHEGPYEFHGIELLDSGKHNLYAAPIEQTAPQPERSELPEELFDGYAVYQETVRHRRDSGLLVRTSPENVSDTLDAVVRLIKARRAALTAQGPKP